MAGAYYEVIVRGRLGSASSRWFDDVEVRSSGVDETRLYGWIADQAALEGLLVRLSDLGLELWSVRRVPETS